MRVHDRNAYLIEPTARVDPERAGSGFSRSGSESTMGTGDCTTSFTSSNISPPASAWRESTSGPRVEAPRRPRSATKFYRKLKAQYGLNTRPRLLVQSNGGLIGYAWAFRHAQCVDRIGGICPVTDFRTWPPPNMATILSGPKRAWGLT